jgi:hypothetical protein
LLASGNLVFSCTDRKFGDPSLLPYRRTPTAKIG